MSKLIPEFSRKGLISKSIGRIKRSWRNYFRVRIRRKVLDTIAPIACPEKVAGEVAYLLCNRDFEMGCIAAWSLLKYSNRPLRLRFFEDGTLSAAQWDELRRRFPGHDFLTRKEVDALVEARFGSDSNIWKARSINPLFHKLVDIPFLSRNGRATYSDPDILYFQSPEVLLDAACGNSSVSWFNRDIESSYFFKTPHLNELLGRAIPERINAGLYSVPTANLDFEKLEKYLGNYPFNDFWKSWRVEQTLFAVLTSENGQEVKWLPEVYDVDYYKTVESVPCKHYVGWIRHGFELEGLEWLLSQGKVS